MSVWALIPVKRFSRAKTRLGSLLSDPDRAQLAEAMFMDTLAAIRDAKLIDRIAVVTDEPAIEDVLSDRAIVRIKDTCQDLNQALAISRKALEGHAASKLAIFPADIPAIRPQDADTAVAASSGGSFVIVPAHDNDGTNALVVTREPEFVFRFGPASAMRHTGTAESAGLKVNRLSLPRIASDLDKPEDLPRLWAAGPGPHTTQVLNRLGLGDPRPFKEVS